VIARTITACLICKPLVYAVVFQDLLDPSAHRDRVETLEISVKQALLALLGYAATLAYKVLLVHKVTEDPLVLPVSMEQQDSRSVGIYCSYQDDLMSVTVVEFVFRLEKRLPLFLVHIS